MPHKNPRCPKCGGRTKYLKSAGMFLSGGGIGFHKNYAEKAFYVCKNGRYGCGYEFLSWAWNGRKQKRA